MDFLTILENHGFKIMGHYQDGSCILEFRNETLILPAPLFENGYSQDQIDDILQKWSSETGEYDLVIELRQKGE